MSDNNGRASRRTLSQAVGERVAVERQRYGLTQDDLARAAQRLGFSWGPSSVAELELGRRRLDAEELLGLPAIFTEALERSVSTGGRNYVFNLGELLKTVLLGVRLTDSLALDRDALRRSLPPADRRGIAPVADDVAPDGPGAAEYKAARRFGVSVEDVMTASGKLWGRPLTAERNSRLAAEAPGDGSPQQRRGHITRQLLGEMAKVLGE